MRTLTNKQRIGRRRIRQLRERYNLTRTELAALMGVDAEKISAWENGHGKPSDEECAENILWLFWTHPMTMAQFSLIGTERIAHKVGAVIGLTIRAAEPQASGSP